MIGKRLAHYEIVGELGRGGMGQVFIARDGKLDREVALKVLPAELASDGERLARFEREARTLAALNHPNIVTIYSVEEADGVRFMTMELVRGTTLEALVPEGGMSMREFLALATPLADAVAAAHDRGIQHRDLKPANVMVADDGRVKVLDFGLAKLRRDTPGADDATQLLSGGFTDDMTAEGKIVGTIAYMSPEQAQGAPIDHRSDVFSLGILMYEMVTGKRPFDGPNNISVLSSILKDEPKSISDVRKDDVPLPLARIIHRALAKRADERYQSTRDLARDLADLQQDLAAGEVLASGMHSGVDTAAASSGPGGWLVAAVVAGVVVAGAIAVLLSSSLGDGDAGSGVATVSSRAEVPSVAVLPFENLTGDDDLEWLREGLPEMLVTDLSQAQNLRVVGTDRVHTIMQRMGHSGGDMATADVRSVAEEAGVGMVVLGSYVRAGEQIRIDARVQDAASSEVLASERISGDASAIFELVDDLSGRIRERVGMQSMSAEMMADMSDAGMGDRDLAEVTTRSVEAYRLYVEGMGRIQDTRPLEAIPLFQRAVGLDPEFGMAWAKLSVAYGNSGRQDLAREAATRAFELSDDMPLEEQLYIRGRYYSLDPATIDESIDAYSKAADLFPNNTAVRNNLGIQYMNRGQVDLAVPVLEEAIALGTEFSGAYDNLAKAYSMSGRTDDAIRVLAEYVEANPGNASSRADLARHLAHAGRLEEAYEQAMTALEIEAAPGIRGILMVLLAERQEWGRVEEQLAALAGTADPAARILAVQVRGSLETFRGRIGDAYAVYERGIEQFEDGSFLQAQVFSGPIGLAHALEDPERVEVLAGRLEASEPPSGPDQQIPVARMFAAAMRGDVEAARRQVEILEGMIQDFGLPAEIRSRVDDQLAAAVAWAARDREAAHRHLVAVYESTPASPVSSERPSYAYTIAENLWNMGRRQESRPWFERVAEAVLAKVEQPVATVRTEWYLGKLAEERRDTAAALHHYRRFLGYWGDGEIDRERVAEARRYVEANG